ncbi:MAG: hypothetical protein IPN95_20405 [Bacteroidetes bacterium]|nr:hypothetical protein [Bacteroidota bacterium]
MRKLILFTLVLLFGAAGAFAQDSTAAEKPVQTASRSKVKEIFYGTRCVNNQTVLQVGPKVLAYRISHRFGSLQRDQLYNFLGLDGPANISFMFDYGIRDNLMVGVGRDQFNKVYNGYVKYNILNQEDGGMPITLALHGKANIISARDDAAQINGFDRYGQFAHRMSYVTQILIARKFGQRLALQIAPTYIHHNLVEAAADKNDIFAIAAMGQFKLRKRLGLSFEYSYAFGDYAIPRTTDPRGLFSSASVGLDIVTGGHVFQIMVVNSVPINEAWAIPFTRQNLLKGDIRLGFNISRNFWL